MYCDKYTNLVPLSFILGFYVSVVMTRWWNQYCSIPFPDNLAIIVGASVKGQVGTKMSKITHSNVAFSRTKGQKLSDAP